jgi:poly(U)-specific endoribonuclease
MFAVEEKKGRADYRGYILPRSRRNNRGATEASGSEHVLSIQLSWNGVVKPVSSFAIGTSPEYEIALYTLAFLCGGEDPIPLTIDETECKIVVHKFNSRNGPKIGSAYLEIC